MIVVAVMIVIEVVDVLKGKVQGSSSGNARNYCDGGSDRVISVCGGSFDSYL